MAKKQGAKSSVKIKDLKPSKSAAVKGGVAKRSIKAE